MKVISPVVTDNVAAMLYQLELGPCQTQSEDPRVLRHLRAHIRVGGLLAH